MKKQTNSEEESDTNSDEWALAVLHEIIICLFIQKQTNIKYILHTKPKCPTQTTIYHPPINHLPIMMAAVEIGWEILVGISHRIIGIVKLDESMLQVPNFKAVDSCRIGEALWWVLVVLVWHHGGVWFAIKVVMVSMTFWLEPPGPAHSCSTGK